MEIGGSHSVKSMVYQVSVVAVYEELPYRMVNRIDLYKDKWGKNIDLITGP